MNLLLTGAFNYSDEQLRQLNKLGYKKIFFQDERKPIDYDVSNINAVVCNALFQYEDITRFTSLKTIQLTSSGLDRIPLEYIKKKSIKVFNAKDVYSIPISEWVVLKVLEIYKNSKQFYKNQEYHKWEKQRNLLEMTDKNALIIGFGSVGLQVAKRFKAFGINVIGISREKVESEYLDEFLFMEDINEGLKKSDIVILTLPLSEETRHLIGKEKINIMKDSAVLINVSRGGIIDETALINALDYGKFLGVGLDVFEDEPLLDSPLWDFENVIITPHNSFVSDRVSERLFNLIVKNLSKGK